MNDMHKLERSEIVYDHDCDTYYGVLDGLHEKYGAENVSVHLDVEDPFVEIKELGSEVWERYRRYTPAKITFIMASDMAAMFSVMRHGGVSDPNGHFCTHCHEHSAHRGMPYAWITVDSDKSIQVVAEEWDMFPETMFAINGGGILGKHPHGENFSEYTLFDRFETVDWERSSGEEDVLDGSDEDAGRTSTGGGGSGQTTQTPAATSSRRSGQSRTGFSFGISRGGGSGKKRKQRSNEPAIDKRLCTNMEKTAMDQWKSLLCDWGERPGVGQWDQCIIPSGTLCRVVRKNPFNRRSEALEKTWKPLDMQQAVPCVLHADMRLSEGLLAGLFRKAHKSHSVDSFNAKIKQLCGVSSKFTMNNGKYESFGLNGPECKKLREMVSVGGRHTMAIIHVIKDLWGNDSGSADFVEVSCELWKTFSMGQHAMQGRIQGRAWKPGQIVQ
jgi:hypothetical protein